MEKMKKENYKISIILVITNINFMTQTDTLITLLNKKVTLFCMNYIYTGILIAVNESTVLLKDPAIVFSTGDFSLPTYLDVQSMYTDEFYIQISSIESFGLLK